MKSQKINKFDSDKIKVFIDANPLKTGHAVRGIGSYTRNLVSALGQETDIELVDNIEKSDIIHYPYFDLFFDTLSLVKKPLVVTIFDTIPLIYPKYYPAGVRGKISFRQQKRKLKAVDAIVTISETSKKDIVRFLDMPEEKITVVHLAPSQFFKKLKHGKWENDIKRKYNLPEKFVLYVGDINYNKNILGLIEACRISNLPLVICGKQAVEIDNSLFPMRGPRDVARRILGLPHPEVSHFKALLEKFQSNEKIIRLGFVPDEDLVSIYNLATVYCQPSFYEGFGLPVIEAMASGVPIVAARTQALVEIGEYICVFVDPKNPGYMAQRLLRVAEDKKLRERMAKTGLRRVKNFSWEKVARETIAIYRKAVNV